MRTGRPPFDPRRWFTNQSTEAAFEYGPELSCVLSYATQPADVTETLTIRLPAAQRKALRARAAATGKSESELVRELIDTKLRPKGSLGERAGHYLGRLDFDPGTPDRDPWRAHLRRTNSRR